MLVLIRINKDAFIPLPLQSYGNLVSACFYMDMNCFGLARVVSSWLWVGSVAADSLRWVVADSFSWLGWFQVVSGGFGWFQMVSVGFDRFPVLVVTFLKFMRLERSLIIWYILLLKKNHGIRDLPSFLTEIFDGFHIVKIEAENDFKTLYSLIYVAYDPVKHFKF